ncbi:MAG: copper amine oxidase N-terminal domain-containing protein [Lachnospirales bacterium]
MKKVFKYFICFGIFMSLTQSVYAKDFATPILNSQAIITEDGLTDDFLYKFDSGSVNCKSDEVIIMVDGEFIPYIGIIKNNTTFVPVRAISETLGKEVKWNENTQEVTIDDVVLTINNVNVKKGNEVIELSAAPFILEGSTYVPLRFIAESFNATVGYVDKNNEVAKLNNSIVWVEEEDNLENAGLSEEDLKSWLQVELLGNDSLFYEIGNKGAINQSDIDNIEYVGQVGRYAVFNTIIYPFLVDVENEEIYAYNKGNGFSVIYDIEESFVFSSDDKVVSSVEEYENDNYPLLASLPKNNIFLYEDKYDDELILVKNGEIKKIMLGELGYITPRFILPELYYNDFDSDGTYELLIDLYVGSGTGVSFEEIHLININEDYSVNSFTHDQFEAKIAESMDYDINNTYQKLQLIFKGQHYTTETLEDVTMGNVNVFEVEDNSIKVKFDIGLLSFGSIEPVYGTYGYMEFDVIPKNGEFVLKNPNRVLASIDTLENKKIIGN